MTRTRTVASDRGSRRPAVVRIAAASAGAALAAACSVQSFVIDRGAGASNDAGAASAVDLSDAAAPIGPRTCGSCTPTKCSAVAPMTALLVDYSSTPASGAFGVTDADGGRTSGASASAYAYPSATFCDDADAPYPITSEVTESSLDIRGTVTTWSGFGLWMGCMVDFSAYGGISFDVWGDPGPTGTLLFELATSPDSPPAACSTNVGTCDGEASVCSSPTAVVAIPATPGNPITLRWSDLTGGSPQTAADPAQILGVLWAFDWVDWAGNRSDPYAIDVHVGSVRLVP